MDISIRILEKRELGLVRDVADVVWPVTFGAILSQEQIVYMMKMMYASDVMEAEYDSGISFHCVFDGTRPVGYLTWGPCDGHPGTAKLHKCYLLPEYQGKGIGSFMLNKAKGYARAAGYSRLRLNVNRHNAKALKAYVRNGFSTVESVDTPIGGGYFMNDYVMEATLELPDTTV